jgi:predicted NAD/FAD-binding protein
MKKVIIIAAGLIALTAPASVAAAPAKLSRSDATASARATAAQVERGLERFGYHAISAKLDRSERLGPRRFRTVVSLIATATRAGARDGSCLFAVYTRHTGAGQVVSGSTSLSCTPLF